MRPINHANHRSDASRQFGTFVLAIILIAAMAVFGLSAAKAQTVTTTIVHGFQDGTVINDGMYPYANLMQASDGNFYGTTEAGGSTSNGTAFKLTPSGTETILHSFADGSVPSDGTEPKAALYQGSDGNFYGTTVSGGFGTEGVGGTVFQMTPSGQETILHSFFDNTLTQWDDGYNPFASLIQGADGSLYGTTAGGGGQLAVGTFFKIGPSGTVTILYSFGNDFLTSDGYNPFAAVLLGSDGNYYTTTGGSVPGWGLAVKLTPAGRETVLHGFGDGSYPDDGGGPVAALIQGKDGNYYGTTESGGISDPNDAWGVGCGTIFRITPSGQYTILHRFLDGSVPNDGKFPYGNLIQASDGNFYGTTFNGGANTNDANSQDGYGVVFKMTPAGVVSIVHDFGSETPMPNDGRFPGAGLVQAADGSLWGTTIGGGPSVAEDPTGFGYGAVFKITISGMPPPTPPAPAMPVAVTATPGNGQVTLSWLSTSGATSYNVYRATTAGEEGATPIATAVTAKTYANTGLTNGTAYYYTVAAVNTGGTSSPSAEVHATPAVPTSSAITTTLLHTFGDGSVSHDGTWPGAGLIQGVDGNLYGTTYEGGSAGAGTIIEMTTAGQVTILHSFADGTVANDGQYPDSGLIQGSDGNFYGTTRAGGSANDGTVFKLAKVGSNWQVTILHAFGDGSIPYDGLEPYAGLAQGLDGNYYGTTYAGGTASLGTVFRITPAGQMSILHNFGDGSVTNDGGLPLAALILGLDGNFYGTTASGGGAAEAGSVFQMTPSGQVTILHSFQDGSVANDGANPYGPLIQIANGEFYGVTFHGGSTLPGDVNEEGYGSAFEMTVSGGSSPTAMITILHSFDDGSVAGDGCFPAQGLIQASDGNFYGTTYEGGSTQGVTTGYGAVFKMTPSGQVTILRSLRDGTLISEGLYSLSGLIQGVDGAFYGMTQAGGLAGLGTAFKVTISGMPTPPPPTPRGLTAIPGHAEVFLSWSSSIGATSYDLYRGTVSGGEGASPYKTGIAAPAYTDTGLTNGTTYYYTVAAVDAGGTSGQSIEVSATPFAAPTATLTVLHSFADGIVTNDGAHPMDTLMLGTDGNYYGTTYQGGSHGVGTVFKITPAGQVTILHSFRDGSVANDGEWPQGGLAEGTDGNFYGTTFGGGSYYFGGVFKITPSGQMTILHSFSDGSVPNDGRSPECSLVVGRDGNFYGTTYGGGSGGDGVVFKMTPSGTVTIVHAFGDGSVQNDGACPIAGLILGSDGNFYGTTQLGESSAYYGTAFKMTPSGTETILHTFNNGTVPNDGQFPQGGLVQGSDGSLYGTANNGGAHSAGIVYKIAPSGQYTILHSFGDSTVINDGSVPAASLIQASDGNFYGTTEAGGSAGDGVVFQMTPIGLVTTMHSFHDGSVANDGVAPLGALVQGADGTFYGTTYNGGSAGDGAVYRLTVGGVLMPAPIATPGNGQVNLTWLPLPAATSYNVYVATTPGGEGGTPYDSGVTSPSDVIYGLSNGTTYYFTFAAVNSSGVTSAQSAEAAATPVAAPNGPTITSCVATGRQIVLKWASGGGGGTSYNVYSGVSSGGEGTTPIASGLTGTSFTNTNLVYGRTYYYKVAAVNAGGTSSQSGEASASIAPYQPQLVSVSPGNGQLTVVFGGSYGATSYDLYRATTSGGEGSVPYAIGLSQTPFTDTGLTNGQTYYYTVTALNAGGQSGQSNEMGARPVAPPPAPTLQSATPGVSSVTLSWTAVSGRTSYNIYSSATPGGEGSTPIATGLTGTSDTVIGLPSQRTYFTVAALNAGGTSPQSNELSATPTAPPTASITVLHSFSDGSVANDGQDPNDGLIQGSDGSLYGTAEAGGSAGSGMLLKITTAGALTVLHSFGDGSVANDGAYPDAGLLRASDGNFYGTTVGGGSAGNGAVFKLTPAGLVTILHSFGDGSVANDGQYPESVLIQDTDGNLYGTTYMGGSAGEGTIFEITTSGVVTIRHSFADGSVANDGMLPMAGLTQGPDGVLYGTTEIGGSTIDASYGNGTTFSMTPSGYVTILHDFYDGSVANDGQNPSASLILGRDGNFYGTTLSGGATGCGVVFQMLWPYGEVYILHSFDDGSVANDGANPYGSLIQASDGNFYGLTNVGGSAGDGIAFQLTPSGQETVLHSFGDGAVANDGQNPGANLVQASDGNFYGTTQSGGSAGNGAVFKMVVTGP